MKRLALAVLATAVVGVAPAQAQTCIGYTPFSVGTLRLGGDLTFADHATEFGATGAFGSAAFGSLMRLLNRIAGASRSRYVIAQETILTTIPPKKTASETAKDIRVPIRCSQRAMKRHPIGRWKR